MNFPADLFSQNEDVLKILLAEDSEDNRLSIQLYLKQSPHEADIAENGGEVSQKLDPGYYDSAFMDIQTPVLDGYTATQIIREMEKLNGLRETPIITLTAHVLKGGREKCLVIGCADYVGQPIEKVKPLEVLRDCQKKITNGKGGTI